jgi:hypothetical protein
MEISINKYTYIFSLLPFLLLLLLDGQAYVRKFSIILGFFLKPSALNDPIKFISYVVKLFLKSPCL